MRVILSCLLAVPLTIGCGSTAKDTGGDDAFGSDDGAATNGSDEGSDDGDGDDGGDADDGGGDDGDPEDLGGLDDGGGVGGDDGDDDGGDDAGDDDGGADVVWDARPFAQRLVVSLLMPGVFDSSDYQETRITSYFYVDWYQDGTNVIWTEELCHIESTEAHGTQTEFPSAFVNTMPVRERIATLSSTEAGANFVVDTFYNVDGADLASPATDSLPTSASDARMVDQDLDGKPGITVGIDGPLGVSGDVYLSQRSEYEFDGEMVSADRFEAVVDFEQEQSIVDASNPFLTIADVVPITNPEEGSSNVVFQAIDPGTDCSDIKSLKDTLF